MAACIVPGCARDAQNNLGVRLRRPDTSAIWAPNTEAFVCDYHALSGAQIEVLYESTETSDVEVSVRGTAGGGSRRTPIRAARERETGDLVADLRPGRDSS
jgi:hypothetical protein